MQSAIGTKLARKRSRRAWLAAGARVACENDRCGSVPVVAELFRGDDRVLSPGWNHRTTRSAGRGGAPRLLGPGAGGRSHRCSSGLREALTHLEAANDVPAPAAPSRSSHSRSRCLLGLHDASLHSADDKRCRCMSTGAGQDPPANRRPGGSSSLAADACAARRVPALARAPVARAQASPERRRPSG
jgi:hypothetical protein